MRRIRRLAAVLVFLVSVPSGFGFGLAQSQNTARKLNPFTGKEGAIKEGRGLYIQYGCSGCHGVGGGGGMGPALTDDEWKFGSDDDTLYKLIKGQVAESTMPKVWAELSDDQVWKMLAYIRSVYKGDPGKINW